MQDGEKCYSVTSQCDKIDDCRDKSDEEDCPWVTRVTTGMAVLLTFAALLLLVVWYLVLVVLLQSLLTQSDIIQPVTLRIPEELTQVTVVS